MMIKTSAATATKKSNIVLLCEFFSVLKQLNSTVIAAKSTVLTVSF